MTRTFVVLLSVLVVATVVSLVWLPAVVGFGCAVGLASMWTWRLTAPLDRRH